MLYIYIDDAMKDISEEYEGHVSAYFEDEFEPEWFSDPFVKRVIKEVDDSEVIGEGRSVNIYNETLGNIPPFYLSSGCKALILLYKVGLKINGDRLGDNCISLLLEIANIRDVYISLSHTPPFPKKFNAVIINNGITINSKSEFVDWKIELG